MTKQSVKQPADPNRDKNTSNEPSIWTHPYLIYVILTCVLFFTLLAAGWLASTYDWIPHRS